MQDTSQNSQNQNTATDEELLLKIAAGDHPSYRVIVERYLPKLWRLSFNVLRNEGEAEDVVQEVLLSVWQNRAAWNPEGSAKFSTWIYRITLNRCIDHKRRMKTCGQSVPLEDDMISAAPADDADRGIINTQERTAFFAMLAKLPENQRAAMLLYYYEDLTVKEISDKLHTTEQSVRSLLKRARKALKTKLESDPDYEPERIQGEPRHIRRGSSAVASRTEGKSRSAD